MTVYTALPTDDLNLAVEVTESNDMVTINITPAIVSVAGGGSGTVTNVATGTGLTGGPITTTGTIAIDTTSDITFNSVTADMYGVSKFTAKAREAILKGQPVYISGHSGNTPEVMLANNTVEAEMPAFGIAVANVTNNNNGDFATAGDLTNMDTTGTAEGEVWAVGDKLYIGNNALTKFRPTGATDKVQVFAKVIRVSATVGQMFLAGAGRYNDVPNLAPLNVFIGNNTGVEERQLTYTDILNTPTIPTIPVDSVNGFTGAVVLTTTNINEGTNEYYTNARADARVDLQTGANLDLSFMDTDDLAEGPTKLYYTDGRVQTVINTNSAGFITSSALTPYSTTAQVTALPVSTFTNDAGYITTAGEAQTLAFADPVLTISGSLSTVDLSALNTTTLAWSTITATPTTVSGYGITDALTPTSTDTLTNKSGAISQWTNDSGYLTTETDSQTLSFTSPNLTISNSLSTVDLGSLEVATIDGGTY